MRGVSLARTHVSSVGEASCDNVLAHNSIHVGSSTCWYIVHLQLSVNSD